MRRALVLGASIVSVTAIAAGVVLRGGDGDPVTPILIDEAASAGVDHVYDGEYPFFVGGGVATLDCNDDGRPDLYLAGGANPAALFVNESEVGGRLSFSERPSPTTDLDLVTGAYPLDVDSDGILDLVVLRRGPNVVLRGLGDCEFEDTTEALGIDPGNDWTVSFAATWESGESLPTLAFGSYLVPDTLDCASGRFLRPEGSRYSTPIDLPAHCTLSLLFSDWNRDGGVDLRVSNDRNYDREAREQLWRIRPGEPPREYFAEDGWRDLTIWGMGIASMDITGDGRPEVYLTSQADNKLQTLDEMASGPTYRDIALARGATAHRPYAGGDVLPSTAWHPEFDDVNNDGLVDLLVTKGNVEAQVDYASNDPNNLLLGGPDDTFVERGSESGIANAARSRGAALVDFNLDGLLDLVVVNRRVPVELRRNVGGGTIDAPTPLGNWIALRLRQPGINSFAVGAWLEVRFADRLVSREVTVGGGHASGDTGWTHVGLGGATSAEVRVTYPDGVVGPWQKVDANSFYDVSRGAPTPSRWTPSP